MRRWIQRFMVSMLVVLLTACGTTAIERIANYAEYGGTPPTVQLYIDAGVTGVTSDNLDAINVVVAGLEYEDVDTAAEVQALADGLGVDITAPIFTSASTKEVAENQTDAITLVATDTTTVTYREPLIIGDTHNTSSFYLG